MSIAQLLPVPIRTQYTASIIEQCAEVTDKQKKRKTNPRNVETNRTKKQSSKEYVSKKTIKVVPARKLGRSQRISGTFECARRMTRLKKALRVYACRDEEVRNYNISVCTSFRVLRSFRDG